MTASETPTYVIIGAERIEIHGGTLPTSDTSEGASGISRAGFQPGHRLDHPGPQNGLQMICRARGHRACEAGPMRRTRRRPITTKIAAVVLRRTMRAVIGIARLRGPRTSRAEASVPRTAQGRVSGMAIGIRIGTGTGIETNREIAPSARGGTTMMRLGGRITIYLRPDVQADDPVAVQTDGPNVMTETLNMKSLWRTRRVDEARTERERIVHDTTTETTLRESQNRLY